MFAFFWAPIRRTLSGTALARMPVFSQWLVANAFGGGRNDASIQRHPVGDLATSGGYGLPLGALGPCSEPADWDVSEEKGLSARMHDSVHREPRFFVTGLGMHLRRFRPITSKTEGSYFVGRRSSFLVSNSARLVSMPGDIAMGYRVLICDKCDDDAVGRLPL
jgi:hypothetical protein